MFLCIRNSLASLGNRIALYVREIRILADFPRYESALRDEHVREGEAKFSIADLERRISAAVDGIEIDADSEFNERMGALTSESQETRAAMSKYKAQVKILTRDYAGELEVLYARKNALQEEKTEAYARMNDIKADLPAAYEAKNEAYADLDHQKRQVDRWHRDTRGRRGGVPEYSMFGPSVSQLRSRKASRDTAYDDVQEAKDAIASMKDEIESIYQHIQRIRSEVDQITRTIETTKRDRESASELRRRGSTPERLERDLGALTQALKRNEAAQQGLKVQREKFVDRLRRERQVDAMEKDVARLSQERTSWLLTFDLEDSRRKRLVDHRARWLAERGLQQDRPAED